MKKRILGFALSVIFILSLLTCMGFAPKSDAIVILYENDVHCAIEGYSKLAAMKKELSEQYNYVGVVSSGDYLQGGSLGVISRGEYIVNIMNIVGYDAITLGNHEFDYKIPRLMELYEIMETKPVCSNFKKVGEDKPVFDAYRIVSYGDVDIAYVGVTTPHTLTAASTGQFLGENGEFAYNFSQNNLYETVQKSIDEAKNEGADIIVAITHLGYMENGLMWPVDEFVANTCGLDVVLDAHSHSVIEGVAMTDKNGNDVIVTSTGTKFASIGKMTISGDEIKTELIPTESYEKTDPEVDEYIKKISEEYSKMGERVVGKAEVRLNMTDGNGTRLIRNTQTNLGNFCSDAYYEITGADISYSNGGGIRADVEPGDITFNNLIEIYPYNNNVCVAYVKGSIVRDMLELTLMLYPAEDGSFPHMTGITFDLDPMIPTSVKLDENGVFESVEGARRVSNIKVFNRESGEYEPLDDEKIYSFTTHNHYLEDFGGGMSMFKDAERVENLGILDIELLEKYITENLGGTVGEKYATVTERINFIDEYVPLRKTFEEKGYEVIWTALEPNKATVKAGDVTFIFTLGGDDVVCGNETYTGDRVSYVDENCSTQISADCVRYCEAILSK